MTQDAAPSRSCAAFNNAALPDRYAGPMSAMPPAMLLTAAKPLARSWRATWRLRLPWWQRTRMRRSRGSSLIRAAIWPIAICRLPSIRQISSSFGSRTSRSKIRSAAAASRRLASSTEISAGIPVVPVRRRCLRTERTGIRMPRDRSGGSGACRRKVDSPGRGADSRRENWADSASNTSSRPRNDSPIPSRYLTASDGLQAADDPAERAQDAGLAAGRHASGRRGLREETAIARAARGRIEDRHLAFEFEDAAVDQRPPGQESRVGVQEPRRKIVRAVDDQIVG